MTTTRLTKKNRPTNFKLNRDKNGNVQAHLSAHERFLRDSKRSRDKVLGQRPQIYLRTSFQPAISSTRTNFIYLTRVLHLHYGFLNEGGESCADAASPEKAYWRSQALLWEKFPERGGRGHLMCKKPKFWPHRMTTTTTEKIFKVL